MSFAEILAKFEAGCDPKFEDKPSHVQLQSHQQRAQGKRRKLVHLREELASTIGKIGGLFDKLSETREAIQLAEKELEDLDKKILACSQAAHLEAMVEQPQVAFDTLIPEGLQGADWEDRRKKLADAAAVMAEIQREVKKAAKPVEQPAQPEPPKPAGGPAAAAGAAPAAAPDTEAEPMDTDDDLLFDKLGEFAKVFTAPCDGEKGRAELLRKVEPYMATLGPVFKRRKQL